MKLDFPKAVDIFKKVRQVHTEIRNFCLAADRPALPIEELKQLVGRMYGLDIRIQEVPYDQNYVRGMLLRYKTHALIYIGKNQLQEWKRFTATKELCHLISDEKEDWSERGTDTLSGLLHERSFQSETPAQAAEQSEVFAEMAAVELLYPFNERLLDAERVAKRELTPAKIASYYEIPESIVRQQLQKEYLELVRPVWEEVDAEQVEQLERA